MARFAWLRHFDPAGFPALERLLAALSNGGVGENLFVGGRFTRLSSGGATPDSANRPAIPQPAGTSPEDEPVSRVGTPHTAPFTPALSVPADAFEPAVPATEALPAPAPDTPRGDLPGDPAARGGVVMLDSVPPLSFGTAATNALATAAGREESANYVVRYGDGLDGAYVMNMATKSLLPGGPGDYQELGGGDDDMLVLNGDFSAGYTLPSQPRDIDQVVVTGSDTYNLVAGDDQVDRGETMTINAMPLALGSHILFDGSAESDGSFVFYGSRGADSFIGGAGNDFIVGGDGADLLAGGGGADTFAYYGAGESTGPAYDTLGDFNAAADKIDLLGTVSGFHAPVEGGSLSLATMNDDLALALGGLGAAQAVWFAPDAGDLAGQIFLVVDAHRVAGYQPGEDYVFAVSGSPLADLSGHTDIFV